MVAIISVTKPFQALWIAVNEEGLTTLPSD
jgi:hypothetical protein